MFYQNPHHCTIELKTKASSCLHLFNRAPPVILTTFRNQSSRADEGDDDDNNNDDNDPQQQQQRNSELLWRYQHELRKAKMSHSQCNLNNSRHHNYSSQVANNNANNMITTEAKFNNSLENKTIL